MLVHHVWRNLAICGHASAGKTTLVDRLLAESGAVSGNRPTSLDQTSICDFDEEEKAHGTFDRVLVGPFEPRRDTIQFGRHTRLLRFHRWHDRGNVGGRLRDGLCINAHDGIQLNSRRAMAEAEKAGIARMIVVTKMDDPQADLQRCLSSAANFGATAVVPIQVPVGQGESLSPMSSPPSNLPGEARGAVINLAHAHMSSWSKSWSRPTKR